MFEKIFGASWRTSLTMYLVAIIGVAQTVITEEGFPHDTLGWLKLAGSILIGVAGRLAKDGNVSNAEKPVEAKPVV